MQISCDVSVGEIIDKLSILYLKRENIKNKKKLIDVNFEISKIEPLVINTINNYPRHFELLMWTNRQIWLENELRTTVDNKERVKELIVNIMKNNDARFRVKSRFNDMLNSEIKEQKSYNYKKVLLILDNRYNFEEISGIITYLSIYYDKLYIKSPVFLQWKQLVIDNSIEEFNNQKDIDILNLAESNSIYSFCEKHGISTNVTELNTKEKYVSYLFEGKLGDFIHHLYMTSVIYHESGRRGKVFLKNLYFEDYERTFQEMLPILDKQNYIHSFEKYNNEVVDYIPKLYSSPFLHKTHWLELILKTYDVNIPVKYESWLGEDILDEYKDTVLFHSKSLANYDSIYTKVLNGSNNCLFITCNKTEYDNFANRHLLKLKLCSSLQELIQIINSCKFYVGEQSSPLAMACALKKPLLAILLPLSKSKDAIHYQDISNYSENFWFYENESHHKLTGIEKFLSL